MRFAKRFLPHLSIVLAGTFVTFIILDKFYPRLAFLNNSLSKLLLLLLCLVSICVAVLQMRHNRREDEEEDYYWENNAEEPDDVRDREQEGSPDEAVPMPEPTAAYYVAPAAPRLAFAEGPAEALPLQQSTAAMLLSKVPEVTIFFWIIKVLCTTVGETASDFMDQSLGLHLGGTAIVMGVVFAIVLYFQFRAKRYIPVLYWATVMLISIFGTDITDIMSDIIHVPLEASTIGFSILLLATFVFWYRSEKTLSIHSITTRRREMFYWLTILFTFSLGTASGDLISEGLGVGYLKTGLLIIAVIIIVAIAWRMKLNADLSFWLVYIMTRPLGASLGDYLSQKPEYGGLGLGPNITSFVFVGAIILTVLFLAITKMDQNAKPKEAAVDEPPQKGFLAQAVAVICVIAVVGSAGYFWQKNALAAQGDSSAAQAAAQTDLPSASPGASQPAALAASSPQASEPTGTQAPQQTLAASDTQAADASPSPAATPENDAKNTKLGDLSSFLAIEQDMLSMVNSGDLAGAKARADDLEFTWDNAEARLKPKNRAEWTTIDNTLDTIFRKVRAVNPSAEACKKAIEDGIAALEAA